MRGALVACLLLAATPAQAALRVTSAKDSGPGSLRAAIVAANRAPGSVIEIVLGRDAVIEVARALPAVTARGTRLEGGGTTLREARGCRRPGGQKGCDGLVVEGADVVVRELALAGFTFDGISVRGRSATDVRIERIEAVDNLDDGVGVSGGAGRVVVEACLLMGNGFRTKGKGLLVFDDSSATLRDSLVVANRDGVTVSRDSKADLDRVLVAGNYDKGVGVSAGALTGRRLQVLANGYDAQSEAPAPNGDGLRVGLGGSAELKDSRIAGNGDGGVVVLDTSVVTLDGCILQGNRGAATSVSATGRLDVRNAPGAER